MRIGTEWHEQLFVAIPRASAYRMYKFFAPIDLFGDKVYAHDVMVEIAVELEIERCESCIMDIVPIDNYERYVFALDAMEDRDVLIQEKAYWQKMLSWVREKQSDYELFWVRVRFDDFETLREWAHYTADDKMFAFPLKDAYQFHPCGRIDYISPIHGSWWRSKYD